MPTRAFPNFKMPLLFAHRGASLEAKENSLEAFALAVELRADVLEMDVHLSADHEVVVVHDASLLRTHGRNVRIAELKASILENFGVPLLKEVLQRFGSVGFNVDIKALGAVEKVVEVVEKASLLSGQIVLTSSDETTMMQLSDYGENIALGMSPLQVKQLLRTAYLGFRLPKNLEQRCLQIPLRYKRLPLVTRRLLRIARDHGIQTHVWVINDLLVAKRLLAMGVEGIMTDDVRLLKQLF